MEIITFSNGDSNLLSTWSNVPYLFLKNLEQDKNVEIVRVNLLEIYKNHALGFISKAFDKICRAINPNTLYTFERTSLYRFLIRREMLEAYKKHPNVSHLISFDFSSSIADVASAKTVMFCDWTIEYKIRQQQNREPSFMERIAIKRQKESLEAADYIICLFPNSFKMMEKDYGGRIYYLGNVINCIDEPRDEDKLIKSRYESNEILFIGNRAYLDSAKVIAKAVKEYNESHTDSFHLNYIGLDKDDIGDYNFAEAYGYLDKGDKSNASNYYKLLREGKCFINTSDGWVGASSMLEAMYYYLPIIVNPNPDLIKTIGEDKVPGYYCENNNPETLIPILEDFSRLTFEEYQLMSYRSHEIVKEFSWDSYIDKVKNILGLA